MSRMSLFLFALSHFPFAIYLSFYLFQFLQSLSFFLQRLFLSALSFPLFFFSPLSISKPLTHTASLSALSFLLQAHSPPHPLWSLIPPPRSFPFSHLSLCLPLSISQHLFPCQVSILSFLLYLSSSASLLLCQRGGKLQTGLWALWLSNLYLLFISTCLLVRRRGGKLQSSQRALLQPFFTTFFFYYSEL